MKNKKYEEIFTVLAVILGLVALQWRLWIANELMVTHDSIIWYGIFKYFASSLHQGIFAFWNPYMNCGEPFFLNIYSLHLLDPSTFFLIGIGKIFNIGLLRLYHYDLFLRYIIFICGGYFFFKHIAKYKISALIAFITLSFSSLCTSYLRQHGFILIFYLFPWILLSICKFLDKRDGKALLWLVFFLGLACCSIHALFIVSAVVIFLVCLFLSKGLPRPRLKILFENYKIVLIALFIFLLLMINLVPAYLQFKQDIIPTVRIFEAPLAAKSFPADFINLVTPYSFLLHFFNWFYVSESFLYIGLIPLLFAIIGLRFSHNKYKVSFMLATAIIGLLMLGENYFIYPLFSNFFPFFSTVRNMHIFGTVFVFCLVCFTCLGLDVLSEWIDRSEIMSRKGTLAFLVVSICFLALLLNSNAINSFRFIIGKYQIISGYLTAVNEEFVAALKNSFYKSNLNVLLFGVGAVTIFSLLTKPNVKIKFKYFVIICFILVDLLLYNHSVYKVVTMPFVSDTNYYIDKPTDNNLRISLIKESYPFYAFVPAMLEVFTAYSLKRPNITTHFYEMKNFYELVHNDKISNDVKDVFAGVSAPKLRLINNAIVFPRNKIVQELEKIDVKAVEKVIFIEEDIPLEYAHLKKPLGEGYNKSIEHAEIKVTDFDPNEITMEVYADEDSFLYYSDGFDKAWRVFIDGEDGKIYRTNLAFKSVIIGKGSHTVRFVYDPKFYKIGLFCFFLGLSSIAILLFFKTCLPKS